MTNPKTKFFRSLRMPCISFVDVDRDDFPDYMESSFYSVVYYADLDGNRINEGLDISDLDNDNKEDIRG